MNTQGHDAWKEQLPAYLLGALSPGEAADLEHHLGGCPECQSELRWLEPARQLLIEELDQVEPRPGLKVRVMAAVEADLAENPVSAMAEPARAVRPAGHRRSSRWAGFKPGQLLRPAVFGAVAAVLFAGVMIGYAVRGGNEGATPAPLTAQRVIPAEFSADGADAVMITSGNSGTLKINDLPELDDGEVYQAWTKKGEAILPTDSLFTPSRNGTAVASIPDLTGVDAVLVSAEPSGGSDQPTTTPVISVPITS